MLSLCLLCEGAATFAPPQYFPAVTAFTVSLLPVNLLSRGISLHSFLQLDKNILSKTQPRHHCYATAKANLGAQGAEHLGCCLASEN